MPENESSHDQSTPGPTPPPRLPEPPPFNPDVELIGYIEKGQKQSVEQRPEPPAEQR